MALKKYLTAFVCEAHESEEFHQFDGIESASGVLPLTAVQLFKVDKWYRDTVPGEILKLWGNPRVGNSVLVYLVATYEVVELSAD